MYHTDYSVGTCTAATFTLPTVLWRRSEGTSCEVDDCIACQEVGVCLQCQPNQRFDADAGKCILSEAVYVFGGKSVSSWEKWDYQGKWSRMMPDLPSYANGDTRQYQTPVVAIIEDYFFYTQFSGFGGPFGNLFVLAPGSSKWADLGDIPIRLVDYHQRSLGTPTCRYLPLSLGASGHAFASLVVVFLPLISGRGGEGGEGGSRTP